jgi:hypothetical protein
MAVDNDLVIVEENAEGTVMTVSSEKRKSKYTIYKSEDGFSMFKIKCETGMVPEQLSGHYTSRKTALKDLTFWLEHVPESKNAKWDRMFGEEKAPPLKTKEKKIGSTV